MLVLVPSLGPAVSHNRGQRPDRARGRPRPSEIVLARRQLKLLPFAFAQGFAQTARPSIQVRGPVMGHQTFAERARGAVDPMEQRRVDGFQARSVGSALACDAPDPSAKPLTCRMRRLGVIPLRRVCVSIRSAGPSGMLLG